MLDQLLSDTKQGSYHNRVRKSLFFSAHVAAKHISGIQFPITKQTIWQHSSLVAPGVSLLMNRGWLNPRPVILVIRRQTLVSSWVRRLVLPLDNLVRIRDVFQQGTAFAVLDALSSAPVNGTPCIPPVRALSCHEEAQYL